VVSEDRRDNTISSTIAIVTRFIALQGCFKSTYIGSSY
jgi:hypothetical protein